MNKRFYPVEREAFTIYILVMTPIFFIIAKPTTEVTAIVLAVVFSVLLFINLILFNEHITLTDDVITWQYFWFKKQFLYTDITAFTETQNNLTINSGEKTIKITRQTGNYEELYRILKQKVPVMKQENYVSFPWKINIQKGKIRQLVFLEESINVKTQASEKSYPISAIKKIYLDGGLSGFIQFRGSALLTIPIKSRGYNDDAFKNVYEAVIHLKPGPKIIIDEKQANRFGYTPERFINTLHTLYPHTAPEEKRKVLPASGQVSQAHAHFKSGNYAAAIKLYEQGLNTEKYDGLAWNRLGQCYLQLGAYEVAAKAFREAVTINAEDADAFYNGAIAYSQLGNHVMIRVYLQEALSLQPDWLTRAKENPYFQAYTS